MDGSWCQDTRTSPHDLETLDRRVSAFCSVVYHMCSGFTLPSRVCGISGCRCVESSPSWVSLVQFGVGSAQKHTFRMQWTTSFACSVWSRVCWAKEAAMSSVPFGRIRSCYTASERLGRRLVVILGCQIEDLSVVGNISMELET